MYELIVNKRKKINSWRTETRRRTNSKGKPPWLLLHSQLYRYTDVAMSPRNKAKYNHRASPKADLGRQDERDNRATRCVTFPVTPNRRLPKPISSDPQHETNGSSGVPFFSRVPLSNLRQAPGELITPIKESSWSFPSTRETAETNL